MEHDETREALELAAVEPGGLDRLMAGDTPQAAAIAGHLAGCEACAAELERLHRSVPLLRDVVRTTPPPELRERTLAFVREHGVARGTAAREARAHDAREAPTPPPTPMTRTRPAILPWVAAIAAAVVVSVAATSLIVGGRIDAQLAVQQRAIAGLQAVTAATLEITGAPDAERVTLAAVDGSTTAGSLLYSPATTRLVVVATGLTPPAAGQEFRCWVLVDGARQPVGRMFFAGDLAFWVGDTPAVATLRDGVTFGVSLTEVGGSSLDAEPVIVGQS
ncbi:MAG: anti-sigma factor domain-containing protein [Candidatus Limnocylindrales bacterium]